MVQLDDLSGEIDQANLPGSTDEYPNWRRKLSVTIEQIADNPRACALMSMMSAVRPAPGDDLPAGRIADGGLSASLGSPGGTCSGARPSPSVPSSGRPTGARRPKAATGSDRRRAATSADAKTIRLTLEQLSPR
jgi:hypothetical protein